MSELRSTPTVSVVIPAHNAVKTIGRALTSVASQGLKDIEVVVVDDASEDGTSQEALKYQTLPLEIKVFNTGRNTGASAARNLGIDRARGEIIAFLDADDEWLDMKLSHQVKALVDRREIVFVSCEANLLDTDGSFISTFNEGRKRPRGSDGWKALMSHPCIATPGIVTWKSILQEAGGFDTSLATGEDQDLWIRLALLGPVLHLDEVLVHVYDTDDSLSKREHTRSISSILPVIVKRLEENRSRLTRGEIRMILGSRYQLIGRNFCRSGQFLDGCKFLAMASLKGFEPFRNVLYLLLNLPPVKHAKKYLSARRNT